MISMQRNAFFMEGWLFFAILLHAGCVNPSSPATATKTSSSAEQLPAAATDKPVGERSANEVLQKLLTTYRQAQAYEDQGVVRLAYRQGGAPVSQEFPVAVAFQRPNKLALIAYQAMVKCDGKELRAKINEPDANNFDNQVLIRPAPQVLKLADLASDQVLHDFLISRLRRQPIQLELLLESGGLISAFGSDVACQRLDDEKHNGRTCFRIAVPSPGGAFIFWIDQTDSSLRRLDYPAAALLPDLASDPTVSDVQLVADLREARIVDSIPPPQFAMDVPPNAKRMKSFVIPPQPLPSSLFGKQPGSFYFESLTGGRVGNGELTGKIAILAWYQDHPACEATLQQVSLARSRLKDDADVAFYAVATDPAAKTNDALQARLADWKVDLPIVRDLEAFGDKLFKIQLQPTIIVLDKQGRVQIFQTGGSPELADQLVISAERLKRGDDLAGEILARHEQERQQYEQLLARGGPEPGQLIEIPEAVIRRRSEPKQLKLQPLWTCSEVKSPGNILMVESRGQPSRIFVIEGWRTVTEIDPQGHVVSRHALDIPDQAAVTFVRSAADKAGRRYYVAGAPLGPQLFLFDDQWKLLLAFPPPGQPPLQLLDLAFARLDDADETPAILAASAGDVGLVALSFSGEVRWRNRAFPNAVSVAAAPADEIGSLAFFVTGETGSVLRVNRFGRDEPPVAVGKWPILRLIASHFEGAKNASLLALSNNDKRELVAVGLTGQLKECWNYPLPSGVHQKPIEAVTSSHVLPGREGEWWLAGPDGSIHVISEDGQFFDSLNYGAVLTGLAATKIGDEPALLVSTEEGLAAVGVQASPTSKPRREY
jgi:hypothetical protein